MKPLKAILYTRVSTDKQAEQGTGLDVQESACFRKAQEIGAEVIEVISDEGVSGAFYLSRPGIQKALQMLEAQQADMLITMKLDRSGRDADALSLIRKRIQKAGAQLVFADGANFENNATGNLLFRVNAGFVEYEKEVIRERTMSGRRKRAEQGQQPSRTQSPFGYHIVTTGDVLRGLYSADLLGKYVVVEEEARLVRDLFARCAAGTSLRQLAKWINGLGVPTQRGGKTWLPSTLRYMLNNPVYKGAPLYGRFQWRTDESRIQKGMKPTYWQKAPDAEQIPLACEPLVSAAVWQACQERLAENPGLFSGAPKRKHLLTGFLRCPKCRRSMSSQIHKGVLSYFCVESRPSRSVSGTICQPGGHRADVVERLLLRDLRWLAQRPERIANALNTFARKQQEADHAPEEAERLRRELADLNDQETAAATAQVDAIKRGRSTAVYETLLDGIEARRKPLQARLSALQAQDSHRPTLDATSHAQRLAAVMHRVDSVLTAEELTPAEKHDILATLLKAIVPEGDGYVLELRSPLDVSPSGLSDFAQVASSVQMISIHCPPGASR